jgi:hypothetical protein
MNRFHELLITGGCCLKMTLLLSSAWRIEVPRPSLRNQDIASNASEEVLTQETLEKLEFRRVKSNAYANFPVNWSDKIYRFGLIRSVDEYDQVFQPAAFGGNKKPYAPDADLYEKEMLLIVGRVTRAPADIDQALVIEEVVVKDKTLEVTFRFQEGPASSTYSVKAMSVVRVPRREVDRVIFFDHETKVDELKVDQGQWLIPVSDPKDGEQPPHDNHPFGG